jgi:hypothetical protein
MRAGKSPLRLVLLLFLCAGLHVGAPVRAQVRLAVDPGASLAWWQVSPHMGHLWATTCPQDTNWYAGGAHSPEYRYRLDKDPMHGHMSSAKAMAEAPIPLFARPTASANCAPAVRGEVVANDSSGWQNLRGLIVVEAQALTTGERQRDDFARKRVLQTDEFPNIRFTIDSLTSVQTGDTITAIALGIFELHGVKQPWAVPIKAWHERLGLRVTGKWSFPAPNLVSVYQFSKFPLGLGVGMQIWKWIHMGFDVVLIPADSRTRST